MATQNVRTYGITADAQKKIIAALNDYKKGVTGAGYGVGGFNKYIQGSASTSAAIKLFGEMVREFQNEFGREVDKMISQINTLNQTYSRIDTNSANFKRS